MLGEIEAATLLDLITRLHSGLALLHNSASTLAWHLCGVKGDCD